MHSPGIDAGEVPPPIPRIATPELFFSFEIGSLEFPHGNNPARDTRDMDDHWEGSCGRLLRSQISGQTQRRHYAERHGAFFQQFY